MKQTVGLVLPLISFLIAACDPPDAPKAISFGDPRLIPFMEAVKRADPASLGFALLPTSGNLALELPSDSSREYDAMLHYYPDPTHEITVGFKKVGDQYRWISQQEMHLGPRVIDTPHGPHKEYLVLEYQIEKVNGVATNKLVIYYFGDDPRLQDDESLTLKKVQPILKEWDGRQ